MKDSGKEGAREWERERMGIRVLEDMGRDEVRSVGGLVRMRGGWFYN